MNGPTIIKDVCEAIKKIKTGKIPGPDGLLAFYYICFELLIPQKPLIQY